MKEVRGQSESQYDYVFHASGTGGTQAGLHLGFKQENNNTQVVGISIARSKSRGTEAVKNSVLQFVNERNLSTNFSNDIIFDDSFIVEGYETTNASQIACIKQVAVKTGIILDPTYTGKAWYGMEQYIKSGKVKAGSNILFWHTGGLLNFMASKSI